MSINIKKRKISMTVIIDWFTFLKIYKYIHKDSNIIEIQQKYLNSKKKIKVQFNEIYYKIFEINDLEKFNYQYNYFNSTIFNKMHIPQMINDKPTIVIGFSNNEPIFTSKILISESYKKKILALIFNNS